jgi:hypothetical protein
VFHLIAKNRAEAEAFVAAHRLYFGIDHELMVDPVQCERLPKACTVVLIGDYWRGEKWDGYYEWLRESQAEVLYDDEVPVYEASEAGI